MACAARRLSATEGAVAAGRSRRAAGTIRDDDRITLRMRLAPGVWKKWVAEHNEYVEGRQFLDEQLEGPFAYWEHVHQFEPHGDKACRLEDRIDYELPGGFAGDRLLHGHVQGELDRMFAYRHRVTRDDLREHHRLSWIVPGCACSSAVRRAWSARRSRRFFRPAVIRRSGSHAAAIRLKACIGTRKGRDRRRRFGRFRRRRSSGRRERRGRPLDGGAEAKIMESREKGTRLLAETLAKLKSPPKTFLCASAVGFYGPLEDEEVDESFRRGSGFLAEVCEAWEAACAPARAAGIRVVNLRFGVVLSPAGGALAKMLPPFQMGAGGRIGDGQQWMSWIAIDDVVGAIHHALMHDDLSGPVNVTAPEPVTNAEFTKTLGRVLKRPTIFPLPAFVARLAFGELANEMLLAGQKVNPRRLVETGYRFRFPDLEPALRHVLGRQLAQRA